MITYIGGDKGGVGKSLVAMIVLAYLIEKGLRPILIESDTASYDVMKAFGEQTGQGWVGKNCDISIWNANELDDWSKTLNVIHDNPGRPIVINSGAGNGHAIAKYGHTLNELEDFRTLWPISKDPVCIRLLDRYMQTVQKPVCVIKNGFFGDEEDFSEFENSKFAKAGMESVYLPKAQYPITEAMYHKSIPFNEVFDSLPLADRLLTKEWFNSISQIAEDALNKAKIVSVEN